MRIPSRCFPRLKTRLRRAAEIAGVSETVLVLASVDATCAFIEKYGNITLPLPPEVLTDTPSRLTAFAKRLLDSKRHGGSLLTVIWFFWYNAGLLANYA